MKPRNVTGIPRVYGIKRDHECVPQGRDFFEARNAMRPGEKVVVSYDEGETWYDLGRSPVSRDDRKH